jgi:hypothetical protein
MMKTSKEAKDCRNFRKCVENSLFKQRNQKTKMLQLILTFLKLAIRI